MTRYLLPALAVAVALAGQGCNTLAGQPEFIEAGISPSALKPGDEALITVKLKDKQAVVSGIEGVVQEDQRITFDLNDRGEQADAEAGDGVWTFGVKVPFQAPEGQFLLDLTAYRSDGNPVPIRDSEGNVAALSSTVPLIISVSGAAPASEAATTEEETPAEEAPVEEVKEEKKSRKQRKSERVEKKQEEYVAEPSQEPAPAPVEEEVAPAPVVEEAPAPVEEAPVVEESSVEETPEASAEEEPKRNAKSVMGPRSSEPAEEEAPAAEEVAPAEEVTTGVEEAQPVDGTETTQ